MRRWSGVIIEERWSLKMTTNKIQSEASYTSYLQISVYYLVVLYRYLREASLYRVFPSNAEGSYEGGREALKVDSEFPSRSMEKSIGITLCVRKIIIPWGGIIYARHN